MKASERIRSILHAKYLEKSITGITEFNLASLILPSLPNISIPTNLRLGHMVEVIVSELIRSSSNYDLLFENIQLKKDKETVGELDFILRNKKNKQTFHVELAYKFYLLDPTLSDNLIGQWIGPNKKDSLIEKLRKLKEKQFPLLFDPVAQSKISEIELSEVRQSLCFLSALYVPRNSQISLPQAYVNLVKGHYLNYQEFFVSYHSSSHYYIPDKLEWGMNPSIDLAWKKFKDIEEILLKGATEKRSIMCWEKKENAFETFFLVWW